MLPGRPAAPSRGGQPTLRHVRALTRPPSLAFGLAVAVLATACGGAPELDTSTAHGLADRADAIVGALEAGDGCAALDRTAELRSATVSARDDGRVSDTVAAEVLAATQRITEGTSCEPAAAPEDAEPPPPPDDGGDDGGGNDDKDDEDDEDRPGRGEGRGNGRGGGDDDD